MTDWETRYYEAEAQHTESNGMLTAENERLRRALSDGANAGCICKGNWRAIVTRNEPRIGECFTDPQGVVWRFFGIVHGDDDYYYGMARVGVTGGLMLSSCVGPLDQGGYYTPEAPK